MLRRAVLKTTHVFVALSTPTAPRSDMLRLGSTYGGWWVPANMLGPDSICYLGGVGEDVTFDLAVMEHFGCEVFAFDPTPRAIRHIAAVSAPGLCFMPVGLWSSDVEKRFYTPKDMGHVSHSITNIQRTHDYFVANCRSIESLMTELGHDHLDLLKLDIEGAEVEVLQDLLEGKVRPMILCVEFDAPEPPWRTHSRIRRLRAEGYVCRHIEGRNYTFTLG